MAREYRDSGIEWIGQIPKEWECTCFKRFHNDANVGESIDKYFCSDNENDTLFYTAGLKPIHTTYKDFPTWKYTSNNDLLLARNGTPYVYLPLPESIYSDHIIRVGIKVKYIREYARYCIQQAISFVVVDAVSIATWSISLWDKQFLPIPSLHEQQKIVDYLDKVCGEIDEMVALQETMIEELKAYKQSVITEAVTKGLNPNVPMRNSGIDWIGEIPEHWSTTKIKKIARTNSGSTPRNISDGENSNIVWIRTTDINDDVVYDSSLHLTSEEYSSASCPMLDEGTCVVAMYGGGGTIGKSGMLGVKATINQALCSMEVGDSFTGEYLFCILRSVRYYWMKYAVGTRKDPNINQEIVRNMIIPFPPIDEQRAIATYLDTKCSEIDALIALKQAKIEELKEYKKSVIYEYVTGKKEVE